MNIIGILQLLVTSSLMYSAPLILTAIAGTFSERSGVVNIGLEGIMVMGAFGSAVFNLTFYETFGNMTPWVAMLFGGLIGLLFASLHAVATINLRADHIVSGTALNLLAPGLSVFLVRVLYDRAQTGPLNESFGITTIPLLSKIPIIGNIFFTNVSPLGYMGIIIGIIWVVCPVQNTIWFTLTFSW